MSKIKWLEVNNRLASTLFMCSKCHGIVNYLHGARSGKKPKACYYCFCPWCGAEVEPYERKYLKNIFNSVVSR